LHSHHLSTHTHFLSLLSLFPFVKQTCTRNNNNKSYSVLPYFLARFSVECVVTFLQALMQLLTSYFLMGLNIRFIVYLTINFTLAIASTSIGILIGSAVEDPNVAAELMPVMIVPQLLFSGFFISTDLIPQFLRWAQYLCSLTYAVRLSLHYEFGDCESDACTNLLVRNGVYELDLAWYWLILAAIAAVFRLFGMILLKGKANFN
jgi:ABC-type multidrug transport system permease subunit